VIYSLSPSSIQPNVTASIQIAGANFDDPSSGATDTVQICPLSSTGAISGGCDSQDVTPASDSLIVVDVALQASLYGYAVTVISDADDEESNEATLGVSTAAPIIYDAPPNITYATSPLPALSGQAVAIIGTNLGSAGTLSICQGASCLPYTISDWGNVEVDIVVDASAANPGSSYTVAMSTTTDSLGNQFLAAPGSSDSTSASVEIDPATDECPGSIVLSNNGITQLPLQAGLNSTSNFPKYLTGIGILATMLATPAANLWNGAQVTESLVTTSNTCPTSFPVPCTGNATFTVGAPAPPPGATTFGTAYPPIGNNQFFDEHVTANTADLLNGTGLSSCQTACAQTYSCNGQAIGSFVVTRTYTHSVIGAASVTLVGVTKQ
jgi:hypothetical protein